MMIFVFSLITAVLGKTVVNLTGAQLDDLTAANSPVFVKFFSPRCPHCVKVAPLWETFASQADGLVVGEIDCTKERDACKRFNVKGVPALLLVRDSKVYRYSGSRDVAGFEAFAEAGYASSDSEGLPGTEGARTWSAEIFDFLSDIGQQLLAILKFSPIGCMVLLGVGFLSGASVTGMVAINISKKAACRDGACADTKCAEKVASPKKPEDKKND